MTMSRLAVVLLTLLLSVGSVGAGDTDGILQQKDELNKLKKEVKQSQRRLDSLQRAQQKVQKQIAEQEQKVASDRKLIRRLNRKLKTLEAVTKEADSLARYRQMLLDRMQRRYLGNIRQLYRATRAPTHLTYEDPNAELEMHREVVYLKALADFESGNVSEISELRSEAEKRLQELRGEHKRVNRLRKQREVRVALEEGHKKKRERTLERLRRRARDEADRIVTLEKAAEEMANIIARLEEQRSRRHADRQTSFFAALKGQLRAPCRGRVIENYGEHVDPVTHLKSFSPGIILQGRKGQKVYAVASGTVAYAGNLRGYGNFVIIDHDGVYYTTYAGLKRILVQQDQHIQARTAVGISGSDGKVRFELRRGRETLDPVEWISIESL
ncbi:MAG: hypothetical protein D6800_11395 [Candidatus Zixiibacteriota bacterium]|nr:MAG: hypothetical protein D6800_11395 [candidate division Zixibacteria bacterium]